MPSILFAIRRHDENVRNAKLLRKLALEAGGDVEMGKSFPSRLPGDPDALRGLPAVGVRGGRGGAIRGTRPGDGLR